MRDQDLKLIQDYEKAGFSTVRTSALLYEITNKKFLPAQMSYVLKRKELDIFQNYMPTCDMSSASKLTRYLESQSDVTFITLVDTEDCGMLLRFKYKGRPPKKSAVNKNIQLSSYEEIKNSLKLEGTPDILMACAKITDEELHFLETFPEVWYVDVTGQTNNEKIQLLVLVGKDGMACGFTGL